MPSSLGPAEIMVILVVALIVLGPKRLPEAGRQVGKALSEVRRWSREVQSEVKGAFDAEIVNAQPTKGPTPGPASGPIAAVATTSSTTDVAAGGPEAGGAPAAEAAPGPAASDADGGTARDLPAAPDDRPS